MFTSVLYELECEEADYLKEHSQARICLKCTSEKSEDLFYNVLASINDPVDHTFFVFHPKVDNLNHSNRFGTPTDAIDIQNRKILKAFY